MRQLNIANVADHYVEPLTSAPEPGEAVQVPTMDVPRSSREARGPRRRHIVDPVEVVVPLVHEKFPGHYYVLPQDTGVYPSQSQ
ncbi:hypothetical protein Fmac_027613 [Flemingia macrophylla]|uniref:Uncharacterized protein n=1 Tax=Flemingia macrophylla TaxID=520843 RepID=A0ABD1LI82_9FABA